MSFCMMFGSSTENKILEAQHLFVRVESYYEHRRNNDKFIII